MNFKKLISLCILVSSMAIAGDTGLLGGLYTIKLHILDPDERYPVDIKLSVLDNTQIKYAKFGYPTYQCDAILKTTKQQNNKIIINEKMIHGENKCEESSYIFYFNPDHLYTTDGSRILKINNSYNNKTIHSVIKSITYLPTPLSSFRIKYKVSNGEAISQYSNIEMLKEYLSLDENIENRSLAIELLFKLTGDDQQKLTRLIYKYPGTKSAIHAEKNIFEKIKLKNTWDAYIFFMHNFPDSNVIKPIVIENALFELTKKSNNKKIYYDFLDKYPSLSEARLKEIKSALFKIAKNNGDIEEVNTFIEKHPDSKYVKLAIFELFKDASKTNTWDSYTKIINQYPKSIYASQALKKIYELIEKEKNIELYLKFLKQFPNSQFQGKVYNTFLLLAKEETEKSKHHYYMLYLKSFPSDINISTYLSATHKKKKANVTAKLDQKEKERIAKEKLAQKILAKESALYQKELKASGLSLITNIQKVQKGERYVPSVTNSYYTTENQSYTVNGHYVNKTKSNKNYTDNGGYYVDIEGFDLVFAIDNESEQPYVVTFEVNWDNTEYYYNKENYCMKRGWIFCSQSGKRYVKNERNSVKSFKKNYIINSDSRIKDKIFVGEKKPKTEDLSYKIRDFKPLDKELYKKIQFINSPQGLEKIKISKKYYIVLKQNKLLSDYHESFSNRIKEIETFHRDKFNKKHLSLSHIDIKFGKKFDPDFDNKIDIIITSKEALLVDLATPNGNREKLAVTKKEEGLFGVCIGCDYTLRLSLEGLSKLSKKEIKDKIKINYVYSPDDKL